MLFIRHSPSKCARPRQQGAALLVVLVVMLLAALLLAWSSRAVLFHARVIGNDADYLLAFEAAHAMLADAEMDVLGVMADGSACQQPCRTRNPSALQIPDSWSLLDSDGGALLALAQALYPRALPCAQGLCFDDGRLPARFWQNEAQLSAMQTAAALYGEFTGAQPDAAMGNPRLAVTAEMRADRRLASAWYWIEPLVFAANGSQPGRRFASLGAAVSKEMGAGAGDGLAYRITAIAQGRKPGSQAVLQKLLVPQAMPVAHAPDASDLLSGAPRFSEASADAPPTWDSAVLSATTSRAPALMWTSAYDSAHGGPIVQAYRLQAGSAQIDRDKPPWQGRNSAQTMALQSSAWFSRRRMLSSRSDGTAIDWRWPQLDAKQQALLNGQDQQGEQRLQWLRGEGGAGLPASGDVALTLHKPLPGGSQRAALWFMPGQHYRMPTQNPARPDVLYVASHGGMLQALDAATGVELLAYVPKGLLVQLAQQPPSNTAAPVLDGVGGSPFTGDVFGAANLRDGSLYATVPKTYLAGFLGTAGWGYFVLDVTAPQRFASSAASELVVMDRTWAAGERFAINDPRAFVGQITAEPVTNQRDARLSTQFVRMNDGRWALVMGNGARSQNGQAALLVQFLEGAQELLVIQASASEPLGAGNGLSAPRLLDLNGDGAVDVAYAGDALGNLWKFDISAADPLQWQTALAGQPLLAGDWWGEAGDPAAKAISTAPAFALHPEGGVMLLLGTGRLQTEADCRSTAKARIVAVHDQAGFSRTAVVGAKASGLGAVVLDNSVQHRITRADLREYTLQRSGGAWRVPAPALADPPSQAMSGQASSGKGWFFELPVAGARVLENGQWLVAERFRLPVVLPALGADAEPLCASPWPVQAGYLASVDMRGAVTPVLRPDGRPFRAPLLKSPAGLARYPGQTDAEPLFTMERWVPSWRQLR